MNPIEKAIRRVDAVQQRHKTTAFAVGLIKKYGDDNGGVLVANPKFPPVIRASGRLPGFS